jgi:hypothetical protein
MANTDLRIVGVALRLPDEYINPMLSAPAPARHDRLLRLYRRLTGATHTDRDAQGFLLSDGTFCRRKAAWALARRNGQLKGEVKGDTFTSENVW